MFSRNGVGYVVEDVLETCWEDFESGLGRGLGDVFGGVFGAGVLGFVWEGFV